MRNRWFLVVIVILLVSWLMTGCGISQSQYDAVTAELNNTKQELQASKATADSTQAKLTEMTATQEKTKTDLQTA